MNTNDPIQFDEAPASWNTRFVTPEGFECQLTLRSESGLEVLDKAHGAIAYLLNTGCLPCTNGKSWTHNHAPGNDPSNGNGNGNDQDRSYCPIHQCSMRKWEKDGRVWFSHKVGDEWCTGKAKGK